MGDYHWAIGVVLAALASVISNLGLNFQKLTHIKNSNASEQVKREYYKSSLWIIGLMMIILGSIADFAALAFGAQSIIAPLGSLTLVSNVFFAPCMLGETLTHRDLLATLAIVAGATIAVIFASHKDTIYGLNDLLGFYEKPRFGLYAIFILVWIGILWTAIKYMETLRREDKNSIHYLQVVRYHRFCYAALSGTIGAQSVLFAKCSAELLMSWLVGGGFVFFYYQTWFVVSLMVATIFLQLKFLNEGLRHFDALYIVPVFQSFWILISVIAGLVFFGEYREMTQHQMVMFPIGIFITISGVYYLSQRGVDEVPPVPAVSSHSSEHKAAAPMPDAEKGLAPAHVSPRPKLPQPQPQPQQQQQQQQQQEQQGAAVTGIEGQARKPQEGAAAAAKPPKSPAIKATIFDPSTDTALDEEHDPLNETGLRSRRGHHYRRIDSTVGFMGTTAPAGFLPSRAMTLANTLRSRTEEDLDPDDPTVYDEYENQENDGL
jgi:uncharacterized membrane protein